MYVYDIYKNNKNGIIFDMSFRKFSFFIGILASVFVFQTFHATKSLAFGGLSNNCSARYGTMCNFDAQNNRAFLPNTLYDTPVLLYNGQSNPSTTNIPAGKTATFTIGYNSWEPSDTTRPHIITWMNISGHGFSSVNAAGGVSSTNNCVNEVMSNSSPYGNSNWDTTPGGAYFCDGESKPIGPGSSPVNTSGCTFDGCSKAASGESAFFYNNQDSGTNHQPRYNISVTADPTITQGIEIIWVPRTASLTTNVTV